MAHGCISSNGIVRSSGGCWAAKWNELTLRSFFQDVRERKGETVFKMHDLVHDLAQSILVNKTPGTETNHSSARASDNKIRQIEWRGIFKVSASNIAVEVSSLTTIMNYSRLRILKLNGAKMVELPSGIGRLKHLRCFDLSHSSIRTLPHTFYRLSNLQILILNYCVKLKSLPGNIRCMDNLHHIFIEGCESLSHMPYRIRELDSLKTLSLFIVGDKIGCQLEELEHLKLGGRLEIKPLERVQNHMSAKKANIVEKSNLRDLVFYWEDSKSIELTKMLDDEKVLEALEPHPNLATLMIDGFQGCQLSLWIKDMKILTQITLRNCTRLPPFGDLPLLKFLHLGRLDALEYTVQKDAIGCQSSLAVKFPSLKNLELYLLPNLKGLLKEEEVGEMFPKLQKLSIWRCPLLILTTAFVSSTLKNLKEVSCSPLILPTFSSKLENIFSLDLDFSEIDPTTTTCNFPENALEGLCNLKTLTLRNATKHHLPEKWSQDLYLLKELVLFDCKIGSCLPDWRLRNLISLEELNIYNCKELVDFAEEIKHLRSLKHLSLTYVDDMTSLPQGLQQIPSLQSLSLTGLYQLTSLPDWLANLASLTRLEIDECPKIQSLPSSIQGMTNLRCLEISECPELERRCEKVNGEDWSKIAHIPQLHISQFYPF